MDYEKLTFEQAIEDESTKSMANSIIKKYSVWVGRYDIYEDLYNLCLWGIWEAIDSYDSNRDTKLTTYLYRCMWRRVSTYIRNTYKGYKGDKAKFNLSYDYLNKNLGARLGKGGNKEMESLTLGDTVQTNDPDIAANIDLYRALEKLDERDRDILISKILLLTPHKKIQKKYGIKRSTVDSRLAKAKKRMREELKIKA